MNLPGAGVSAAAISMHWSDGVAVPRQMVAIRRPGVYPRLLFSKKAVINLEKNIPMRLETGLRLEPYSTAAAAATAVTAAAAAISIHWGGGVAVRRQMVAIHRPGVYPRLLFSES